MSSPSPAMNNERESGSATGSKWQVGLIPRNHDRPPHP